MTLTMMGHRAISLPVPLLFHSLVTNLRHASTTLSGQGSRPPTPLLRGGGNPYYLLPISFLFLGFLLSHEGFQPFHQLAVLVVAFHLLHLGSQDQLLGFAPCPAAAKVERHDGRQTIGHSSHLAGSRFCPRIESPAVLLSFHPHPFFLP